MKGITRIDWTLNVIDNKEVCRSINSAFSFDGVEKDFIDKKRNCKQKFNNELRDHFWIKFLPVFSTFVQLKIKKSPDNECWLSKVVFIDLLIIPFIQLMSHGFIYYSDLLHLVQYTSWGIKYSIHFLIN